MEEKTKMRQAAVPGEWLATGKGEQGCESSWLVAVTLAEVPGHSLVGADIGTEVGEKYSMAMKKLICFGMTDMEGKVSVGPVDVLGGRVDAGVELPYRWHREFADP